MHTEIKLILYLSIAISAVTLAACLIFGPMLHAEMTSVWDEIDEEIKVFKAESDVLWNEMQEVKNGARLRRQVSAEGAAAGSGSGSGSAAEPPRGSSFVSGAGWICPTGKGWICPTGKNISVGGSVAESAAGSGVAVEAGTGTGTVAGGATPVKFENSLLCSKSNI